MQITEVPLFYYCDWRNTFCVLHHNSTSCFSLIISHKNITVNVHVTLLLLLTKSGVDHVRCSRYSHAGAQWFQECTDCKHLFSTSIHCFRSSRLSADKRYLVCVVLPLLSVMMLVLSPGWAAAMITRTKVLGRAQSRRDAIETVSVLQFLRSISPWGCLFWLTSSSG